MAVKKETNVDFVDEQERALFGEALLGEDVLAFLKTPVGRYLHHRAKMEIQQCQVDALEVNPDGWSWLRARTKLRAIQQRASAARLFMGWMADAITNGNQAATQLEEYRNG